MLSQSEGQVLIDIMNYHGFEQLIHFQLGKRILDLNLTYLPGQFQGIHSPDNNHDIVAGILKSFIPPKKKNLGGRFTCITKVTATQ